MLVGLLSLVMSVEGKTPVRFHFARKGTAQFFKTKKRTSISLPKVRALSVSRSMIEAVCADGFFDLPAKRVIVHRIRLKITHEFKCFQWGDHHGVCLISAASPGTSFAGNSFSFRPVHFIDEDLSSHGKNIEADWIFVKHRTIFIG